MDCNQEAEQKKEDYKYNNTEHCLICDCTYVALSDNMIVAHLNSTKHKKNDSKKKRVLSIYHYYRLKNCKQYAVKH